MINYVYIYIISTCVYVYVYVYVHVYVYVYVHVYVYVYVYIETVNEVEYVAWQLRNPIDGTIGNLEIMTMEETIPSKCSILYKGDLPNMDV
jgi:hypothetical protein